MIVSSVPQELQPITQHERWPFGLGNLFERECLFDTAAELADQIITIHLNRWT